MHLIFYVYDDGQMHLKRTITYPSLLSQQLFLLLETGSSHLGGVLLNHGRVRVQFHQCPHVGKRIAVNGSATNNLPAWGKKNKKLNWELDQQVSLPDKKYTYIGRLMTFWISSDFKSLDKSVPVMMG